MSALPKIVYFGSDAICLPGLKYLHEEASDVCTIAAVISQPDRPQGRGKKLQANPVAAYASEAGIKLLQPEKPDRNLSEFLKSESVALAYVMAYGHFLPKSVREAPTYGMLNFHGSILPAYRGASPVETAIAMGEVETGVCLMKVAKEMDAGDVADCERIRIEDTDTSPLVRTKIGHAVLPLLERSLKDALVGRLSFRPQDSEQATFCRKIFKEDAALDFTLPAADIHARLRAFTPWPGGYFDHGDIRIKVGACSIEKNGLQAKPGTLMEVSDRILVATGDGLLCIHELQRPGGRMLLASDFLRGYPISEGEVLSSVSSKALISRKEP